MSDGRLPVRRRWIRWTIGTVVTLLLIAIGWVAIRGAGAVLELQQVAKGAGELRDAIGAADLDRAQRVAARVEQHAATAHDLTSDPVWAAFEVVPWLGPNFSAVGEVADIADSIAGDAVAPVLTAAEGLDLAGFGFTGGTIDLAPFAAVQEPLAQASATLSDAEARALLIDAGGTLPPLEDAVTQMRATVVEAATVVGALHGASVLLPDMLGAAGPRIYIIAMQNNAELRSEGGIIGSLALVTAENGRISIIRQASTRDFPGLDQSVPLSESTIALFDDGPGRYIQNVTSIPDFTEAGPIIAARWQQQFGETVDGVIAVDAVVAQHLLEATGPITVGPFSADSGTILDVLLSQVYAAVPDPVAQDAIFAQAATGLLGATLNAGEPKELVAALAESAGEGRVRVWSVHEDEQSVLADTTLGGALPRDDERGVHVGVLFNDTTGAKMDYYTRASLSTAVGACHGEATTQVTVTWTNTAPPDAGTSLPPYVTGAGEYGVPPGSVRTLIAVYGPEGATPSAIDRDGEEQAVQTAMLGTRSTVQHEVLLAPGESTTITVSFTGDGAGERLTTVQHTPMITTPEITREPLTCE